MVISTVDNTFCSLKRARLYQNEKLLLTYYVKFTPSLGQRKRLPLACPVSGAAITAERQRTLRRQSKNCLILHERYAP